MLLRAPQAKQELRPLSWLIDQLLPESWHFGQLAQTSSPRVRIRSSPSAASSPGISLIVGIVITSVPVSALFNGAGVPVEVDVGHVFPDVATFYHSKLGDIVIVGRLDP